MSAVDDVCWAAAILAVGGAGVGGVCLRSGVQPARVQWLEMLRELLPIEAPIRRVPFNIGDGRLLGGLDLTATLKANRPVAEQGVLAATDGGIVIVTMAERLSAHTAACLTAVLDAGEVHLQREGVLLSGAARIAVVALDESMTDDESVPVSLLDRLALLVDLNGFDLRTPLVPMHEAAQVLEARRLLPMVDTDSEILAALCATGLALGAGSVRVSLLAVRVARAVAALEGRTQVTTEDATIAGRLVFAPRATRVPQETPEPPAPQESPPPQSSAESEPPPNTSDAQGATEPGEQRQEKPLEDVVIAAAQAAIPAGLLARLRTEAVARRGPGSMGRVGALQRGGNRGRPAGVRAESPRGRSRLNVMETLRAAAPWQRLRGRTTPEGSRVRIEPADFRVTHYRQRSPSLTIFAVDASGSSALNRLAEAKGAVELLLADCYVRRDQVAVITFRGRQAEVLLPPTRSLVRAKRNLAATPGGGGTPLAAGIDSALAIAEQSRRRGATPLLVMLTDGRANVSRNGTGGREGAHADALDSARRLRKSALAALLVDTSPRSSPLAQQVAAAMGALYVPLPFADARSLSSMVNAAAQRAAR